MLNVKLFHLLLFVFDGKNLNIKKVHDILLPFACMHQGLVCGYKSFSFYMMGSISSYTRAMTILFLHE